MRATCLAGFALIALGGAGAFGQGAGSVGRVPRAEVVDLRQLVDGLVGGVAGGDDVQIKWDGHFMRAGDGRVYVPFTVTLNDVAHSHSLWLKAKSVDKYQVPALRQRVEPSLALPVGRSRPGAQLHSRLADCSAR